MKLINLVCDKCSVIYVDSAYARNITPHLCGECSKKISQEQPKDAEDKYGEEVRRIAEILSFFRYKKETYFGAYFTEEDKKQHWDKFECKESYITGKEAEDRAMVAEMAKAYEDGYDDGFRDRVSAHPVAYDPSESGYDCIKGEVERGLIQSPSKTEK
mgnify:CR=1 FL=1